MQCNYFNLRFKGKMNAALIEGKRKQVSFLPRIPYLFEERKQRWTGNSQAVYFRY